MCEGLWQTLAVAGEEHFKVTKPEKQVTDRDRKQFTMKPKTPNTESWKAGMKPVRWTCPQMWKGVSLI